jgi:SdrD B-like domain
MTRFVSAAIAAVRPNRMDKQRGRQRRLGLEALDDRVVPTVSTISSTFNGTKLAAGSTIWFSSVMKVTGLGTGTTTLTVDGGTITSSKFSVDVPDAVITFTPLAVQAVTTFDAGTNTWFTTAPLSGLSGNLFITGAELPLPTGLAGGVKPVTWTANFTTDTPGLHVSWQWAAAAYKQFNTDLGALGVKPTDDPHGSSYQNSDHAGTPENYKRFVVGGARGGGGSNFTGSYSATKFVTPDNPPPPPGNASLSGFVYLDGDRSGDLNDQDFPIGEVLITLYDGNGNFVTSTLTDDNDGSYSFSDLAAGTYTITETQPIGFDQGTNNIGSLGGSLVDDSFTVEVHAGDNGINYNFGEINSAN